MLTSHEEVKAELDKYLKQDKKFKSKDTEKMVYEKVNNLKQVNLALSIMYNQT